MSNKLLIYVGAGETFSAGAVDGVVRLLAGWTVTRLGPGIGALEQYLCAKEAQDLTVRLSADGETITIDGHLQPLSAELALSLQSAFSQPLRMTDMDYSFDLPLRDFGSSEELVSALTS